MPESLVVFTGAGISAESGLATFRDAGGLWEGYRPEDVATPEAWQRHPELVLRFYNERRDQLRQVQPNAAHRALVELESAFDLTVITQNVDDLHERAGSRRVLHLHGELMSARSEADPQLRVALGEGNIHLGDRAADGQQLRPDVVWFGEMVPAMEEAAAIVEQADRLLVIGTSLSVWPAAGLLQCARRARHRVLITPWAEMNDPDIEWIRETACHAVPELVQRWLANPGN